MCCQYSIHALTNIASQKAASTSWVVEHRELQEVQTLGDHRQHHVTPFRRSSTDCCFPSQTSTLRLATSPSCRVRKLQETHSFTMATNPPTDNAEQMAAPETAAAGPNGTQPTDEATDPNATDAVMPPAQEPKVATRKDASLKEFLNKMDDYAPIVRALLRDTPQQMTIH
jgi:hypothetical protein